MKDRENVSFFKEDIKNELLYYLFIFIISLFVCCVFLVTENLLGIHWDYHPDSTTYVELSNVMMENMYYEGMLSVINNLYYIVAAVFQGDIILLVLLNMLFYGFTNIILSRQFKKYVNKDSVSPIEFWILLFILLFNPYRIHLAVHVLKDTIIIFCLCLFVVIRHFRLLLGIVMLLFRASAVLYCIDVIKKKYLKFFAVIATVFILFEINLVLEFLRQQNEIKMHFRAFDSIPNFSELGIPGALIRAIVWPFFVCSGLFIFISPSIMYLPLAISSFLMQCWCLLAMRRWGFLATSFLIMSLFALLVPGFTSYIRYCYPVFVVMPILLMQASQKKMMKKQKDMLYFAEAIVC